MTIALAPPTTAVRSPAWVYARRRERDRLVVPAVAAARLPERAAAEPAMVAPPRQGPSRHLHAAVDRDHHRPRPHRLRIPVRERGVREHQHRAHRGGPDVWLV